MSKSNSKTWGTWAIRKIRNGRVKFHKHWYYPEDKYHGELDGLWIVFHSYDIWDGYDVRHFYPCIHPWGTLDFFNMRTEEEIENYDVFSSPLVDKDGSCLWDIWYPQRPDLLGIVNKSADINMRRLLAIQCMQNLLPELPRDEQWMAIDWHYRESYPSYQPVHTNPERYANVHIIEGLK